jgi:hypothetical protein
MEPFNIYVVKQADQWQEVVSMLPHEHVFKRGLAPEAIVGVLLKPTGEGGKLEPSNFARNSAFVQFLHEFIVRTAPIDKDLVDAARKQRTGHIFIIDARTPTPQGAVPPYDIIGAFGLDGGEIMPGSYQANPGHQILSASGFFSLGPSLMNQLREELERLNSGPTVD